MEHTSIDKERCCIKTKHTTNASRDCIKFCKLHSFFSGSNCIYQQIWRGHEESVYIRDQLDCGRRSARQYGVISVYSLPTNEAWFERGSAGICQHANFDKRSACLSLCRVMEIHGIQLSLFKTENSSHYR